MIKLRPSSRKASELRFEVVPLIDVMFTLLIFFVIYSTVLGPMNKKGIKLKLPTAESSAPEKKGISISINSAEKVFFDSEETPVDLIKVKIARRIQEVPDTYVTLSSDRSVSYDQVMQVLDNIRLGGCANIVLEAAQKTTKPHE